ncbi:MAG TPA: DNA/RNA non-specific endonuclease [Prolixibacteraceae bacterium]|jgi:endonuclease G
MKRLFFLFNCLVILLVSNSNAQKPHLPFVNLHPEIPRVEKGDVVISHVGYSFLYKEEYEQSSWVAYELTKEETQKVVKRSNQFKPDPAVSTLTANNADYAGSGYDKGHLAPAADMGWSATTMAESFYFSNMSPQVPGFNRGIWKKLEELVRSWAIENNSLLIVTGPVLKDGLKTIGPDHVAVPELFYKVILDNHEPEIKGIAFLIPNASQSASLQSFVVPIDSVESVTGIDFFPNFPNEATIEKTSSTDQWSWTRTTERVITSNQGVKDSEHSTIKGNQSSPHLQQCHGITKAGTRCQNKTLNASGYCHLHEPKSR